MLRSTSWLVAAAVACSSAPPAPALPQGYPLCAEEQVKLVPDDGATLDHYGGAVSISGDTALVGSSGHTGGGAVYVYVRSGSSWSQQAKLAVDGAPESGSVGDSVAIDGDTAVAGAPTADGLAPISGAAYVFVRSGDTWSQRARLVASQTGSHITFGYSVALSGDTALIGAPSSGHESAYVFVGSGASWSEQAWLVPQTQSLWFGWSVSISGETAAVGAYMADQGVPDGGAAFVYVRSGSSWSEEALIVASDAALEDRFGWSVAIAGDALVVGAPYDDAPTNSGSAYLFTRTGTTWSERGKLRASGGATWDRFGWAVAAGGDTALVGMPFDDDLGESSGSAFAYAWPPPLGSVYCTCPAGACGNPDPEAGCANSTGAGALLTAQGSTAPDAVNLLVSGARPNQFSIFFEGGLSAMQPFGDGFRCAGGTLVRITPTPIQLDSAGRAAYGPCFGHAPISTVTGAVPGSGETRRYQFWYRDPGGPCGSSFNLSNGCAITW